MRWARSDGLHFRLDGLVARRFNGPLSFGLRPDSHDPDKLGDLSFRSALDIQVVEIADVQGINLGREAASVSHDLAGYGLGRLAEELPLWMVNALVLDDPVF